MVIIINTKKLCHHSASSKQKSKDQFKALKASHQSKLQQLVGGYKILEKYLSYQTKIINNYNNFIGGVDIADQYRSNIILII